MSNLKNDFFKDGKENAIIGEPKLKNSRIYFRGKGNVLFCEKNVSLKDCLITFAGDNSIIYLSKNKYAYKLRIDIFTDCSLYFGKDNYMTGEVRFIIQEHANILIGNNNLIATNVKFRTSDAHAIYDIDKKERINPSGNVLVGDHVWLCSDVNIYKNVELGSGSIIGGYSLVSNKIINSNTLNVGIPVKEIKDNVYYDSKYVGKNSANEEVSVKIPNEDFIFNYVDDELIELEEFKNNAFSRLTVSERFDFFEKISKDNSKNRFFRKNQK